MRLFSSDAGEEKPKTPNSDSLTPGGSMMMSKSGATGLDTALATSFGANRKTIDNQSNRCFVKRKLPEQDVNGVPRHIIPQGGVCDIVGSTNCLFVKDQT
jgi:hypothetical protein